MRINEVSTRSAPAATHHAANGLSIRTPTKSMPFCRSSDNTTGHERLRAASTIAESQREICHRWLVASAACSSSTVFSWIG